MVTKFSDDGIVFSNFFNSLIISFLLPCENSLECLDSKTEALSDINKSLKPLCIKLVSITYTSASSSDRFSFTTAGIVVKPTVLAL